MLSACDLPPETEERGDSAPENAMGGEETGRKTCPGIPRDAQDGVWPACRGDCADVLVGRSHV